MSDTDIVEEHVVNKEIDWGVHLMYGMLRLWQTGYGWNY